MEIKINGETYKPVIGFEIHLELATKSKMFCRCSADWFGKEPNIHVCPVCLGMPGALPYPNRTAIEYTYKIAMALNCQIREEFHFDRKHYFYPDLPKGYQITQWNNPIGKDGYFELFSGKKIRINRVHLEEDTGKLIHEENKSLVDFNRAGVPLVEIVTEPDFNDPEEGKEFLEELQRLIRYLGVSDADMEKGSMRLEPNISLGKVKNGKIILPDYKVEIKNINSFRFVKRAIEYDLRRQAKIIERGETPKQETRGFIESKNITKAQRSKEEAFDYRYFPEPDIPPIKFDKSELNALRESLPELPLPRAKRFIKEYGLKESDARILVREKEVADFYESLLNSLAKEKGLKVSGKELAAKVANFIVNKRISLSSKEKALSEVKKLLAKKEVDLELIRKTAQTIIQQNPKAVNDYKKGKQNALFFLVGACMRILKDKGDAAVVKKVLEELLSE